MLPRLSETIIEIHTPWVSATLLWNTEASWGAPGKHVVAVEPTVTPPQKLDSA